MKHIIDIETWERKSNYEFFKSFQNPTISITSEVECGGAQARAKAAGQSFFLHYLYAVLRAVNEIPEFRFRIDAEGNVVYFDNVDMLTPIKVKENGRFFTIRLSWNKDFNAFYASFFDGFPVIKEHEIEADDHKWDTQPLPHVEAHIVFKANLIFF